MTANPRSIREGRSIHLVILLVPLDEACEPDRDRGRWLEAEVTARPLDIGIALWDIARLQRQQLLPRRAPQQPLDNSDEVEELLGAVIAEIIDAVANPVRARRRRAIMGRDRTRDDVVDVSKVTGHPALIEDLDRLAGQNRPGEQISRHVRPAPRTINSKKPQPRRRQTVKMAVGMRIQLAAAFCRGIERDRLVDPILDAEGLLFVRAVDRG